MDPAAVPSAPSYLVLFVADRAEDSHAAALRELASGLKGAGFFDDPELGGERTTGTFMRTETLAEPAALELIARVAELSGELELRIEVQHREVILGHLERGRPDEKLAAALGFAQP
jgi:hypothetical protein